MDRGFVEKVAEQVVLRAIKWLLILAIIGALLGWFGAKWWYA